MYCTGGVRCERASAFLRSQGYRDVVQLRGRARGGEEGKVEGREGGREKSRKGKKGRRRAREEQEGTMA
jgi:rhodanese-related sulfurtransferase